MKKYLKYLILIFVCFLSFKINVFATIYANPNAKYNITIPDFLLNIRMVDDTHTFGDFIQYLSSHHSDYYDLFVYAGPTNCSTFGSSSDLWATQIYMLPKNVEYTYGSMFATRYSSSSARFFWFYTDQPFTNSYQWSNGGSILQFQSSYPHNNSYDYTDLFTTQKTIDFLDCYVNNNCNNMQSSSNVRHFYNDVSFATNLSNDNSPNISFTTQNCDGNDMLYYTSKEAIINAPSENYPSRDSYIKSIKINGIDYPLGDSLPTYCSIHDVCPVVENKAFVDYKPKLGTIYSNMLPTNVSSFDLKVSFDTSNITALQYLQNLDYTWNCYGRVNHNNDYYTYEEFPYCDFEQNGDFVSDSEHLNLRFNNFKIYDSNDQVINDFSRYDKIFNYISFQYKDDSLNRTISNLDVSFNGGLHYDDYFSGVIYDRFDLLPSKFKLFLSTSKQDNSYFSVAYSGTTATDKYFINRQQYRLSNLEPVGNVGFVGTSFSRFSVNGQSGLGYMFFHQISNVNFGTETMSLDFLLMSNIVISLRDSSSDNFYYIDSSGNIVSNDITINYDDVPDDSYDILYYVDKVNEYLDSLESNFYDLGDMIQSFYDSTPAFFQDSLLILFILFCMFTIYKFIKKE